MDLREALGRSPVQNAQSDTVVVGRIGNPVPQSFADQVMVLPQQSADQGLGPMDWGKVQGQALPQYGAPAIVVFDENATPYCVWFDGAYVPDSVYAPQTAPSAPASGFVLYVDEADGKLKAKASSGTITTLATQ